MRQLLLMAMSLLAALPSASAEVIDIYWSGDGRFSHKNAVPAGKFVEVCGKLPAGLKVSWDFESSIPMDFNVHYHVGKDAVFPTKLAAVTTAKDVLETKVVQDYCWMWSNKSAMTATFTINMER